ncbi:uncharacterized protein I303_102694 [Kwoniella dejecticola CBS 10117]|uniref:Uncharacterized protein n=1 Tax=Kwoniella dejecticola CBS 10117 TaxID=1296121 RepID=A0AAJ8KM72_9TREE
MGVCATSLETIPISTLNTGKIDTSPLAVASTSDSESYMAPWSAGERTRRTSVSVPAEGEYDDFSDFNQEFRNLEYDPEVPVSAELLERHLIMIDHELLTHSADGATDPGEGGYLRQTDAEDDWVRVEK